MTISPNDRPRQGHSYCQPINMSLVNLAHVCSHLNNATKARLGLTSIPNTNLHLNLCLALQNSGYLSSVVRAGPTPPPPHKLFGYPAMNDEAEGVEPITRENVASRRLWLGLKYWQNQPVLGKMSMVSKPTRRIHLNVEDLRQIARGYEARTVRALRSPGENLYLSTDVGILEARECVEKRTGGLVLCRVL